MPLITCPSCGVRGEFTDSPSDANVRCAACGDWFGQTSAADTRHTPGELDPEDDGPDELLGREVGGCTIESVLGRGGMGTVYRAQHHALDIPVALKVFRPRGVSADSTFGDRFVREARAAARLRHPNIVGVLNAGEDAGVRYIIMRLVDGESLEDKLRRDGAMDVATAATILREVARALDHAHANSFVHRDVKPDNVMLARDGSVQVADLGLAKELGDDQSLTQTGVGLGTPHYMAPEQALDVRTADQRSDVYALGCMLFRMLTGRVPYEGPSGFAVLNKHMHDPVPDPRDLDAELSADVSAVIARTMAKQPAERYATAGEVIAELDRIVRGEATNAGRNFAAHGERAAAKTARLQAPASTPGEIAASRRGPLAGLAVALLVAVGLGVLLGRAGTAPPAATGAPPIAPPAPLTAVDPPDQVVPAEPGNAPPPEDWLLRTGPVDASEEQPVTSLGHDLSNGVFAVDRPAGDDAATLVLTRPLMPADFDLQFEVRNAVAVGLVAPGDASRTLRIALPDDPTSWHTVVLRRRGTRLIAVIDQRRAAAEAVTGRRDLAGHLFVSMGPDARTEIRWRLPLRNRALPPGPAGGRRPRRPPR